MKDSPSNKRRGQHSHQRTTPSSEQAKYTVRTRFRTSELAEATKESVNPATFRPIIFPTMLVSVAFRPTTIAAWSLPIRSFGALAKGLTTRDPRATFANKEVWCTSYGTIDEGCATWVRQDARYTRGIRLIPAPRSIDILWSHNV